LKRLLTSQTLRATPIRNYQSSLRKQQNFAEK
jgi:hypothetical protein